MMDVSQILDTLKNSLEASPELRGVLLNQLIERLKDLAGRDKNKTYSFTKAFDSLLLEIFAFEQDFETSKEKFTNALLNQGIKANSDFVFSILEMTNTRLLRVFAAKQICMLLGLHQELDRIIDKELDLIYHSRERIPLNGPPRIIVGEQDDGSKK